MVTKIGTVAAVALVAFLGASGASFAASKHKNSDTGNSFNAKDQCTGGACTSENPDRVPNKSAQFYKKQKHTMKKPAAPADDAK